jgi:CheY-like chemotaxis protein
MEARAAIESGCSVDLVFSDVVMSGGMSGVDLLNWLRKRRPMLPVLLTSGYSEEIVQAQERREDDARILQKPYSQADLARAIRDAITAVRARRP